MSAFTMIYFILLKVLAFDNLPKAIHQIHFDEYAIFILKS